MVDDAGTPFLLARAATYRSTGSGPGTRGERSVAPGERSPAPPASRTRAAPARHERPGRAAAYAAVVTRGDLDLIISGLVKLRREVDLALDRAVLTGRAEHDLSWDEVAALTAVTARTAAKRWGET